jgi:hypothetical protein
VTRRAAPELRTAVATSHGRVHRLYDRFRGARRGRIVARVLEVPGALSQGRTREQARDNALDALRTVLTPDDELAGRRSSADLEHLRFVVAA